MSTFRGLAQTPMTGKQKTLVAGVSLPVLIALGYGGLILFRIFRARRAAGGAGENTAEAPGAQAYGSDDPRCQRIEDQLSPPAGCGTVKVLAYKQGDRAEVMLRELPGRPGFYLQTSPVNAWQAFNRMAEAIGAAGITLRVNSAFRTMAKQKELYSLYLKGKGNLAAKPGRSNHQYGTTVDLGVAGNPKLLTWLKANGSKYGFYKTVPSEDWHWEYKG